LGNGKGKTKEVLFGSQKQQLKHLSKKEYLALKELCLLSKNMYNVALYNVRQSYFVERKFLSYESNYHICKENENYGLLNSNMAQQIMKVVDRNFKSFFSLIELAKKGNYQYRDIKLPHYLKKDGNFNLIFNEFNASGEYFSIPMSPSFKRLYGKVIIAIPPNLKDKTIKEIRILPINDARRFEIQYIYEYVEVQSELNFNKALAIDLGIDNLATCVTNEGESFIIDGRKLKSVNQWSNKRNARLQGIKDMQKTKKTTKAQQKLWSKRNNTVNDYLNKSAKLIIDYCLQNSIGNLVVGYNPTIQKDCNIGRINNQNFVNLPIGKLKNKLDYLCKRYGIKFIEQEESYTSKSSYFDNDILPTYRAFDKTIYTFSGKRIKRGLYKTAQGYLTNADQNGALNILKKSSLNGVTLLQGRGDLKMPKRIRVA
jgi:putative transposase